MTKKYLEFEILWTEQDESGEYSWKHATIIDQKMIEKFSMKLKKSNSTIPGMDYNVTIHTDKGQHQLTFSEVDLRLGGNKYFILEGSVLINLIKRENLKWEPFF